MVRALAGTILVGGIGGRGFHFVAGILKEIDNFTTAAEFTTKIHADVFVRVVDRETVLSKPTIEKINRRGLVGKAFAVQGAAVVVDDETVACLVIETLQATDARRINTRGLDKEAKVDRDALAASGSAT